MPASTPIARCKTSALARVLDSIPKSYAHYTTGSVAVTKAAALAAKFHRHYSIGATPAQRITRKKKGMANSILVMYWPESAEKVEWLLISTDGAGLEAENMSDVTDRRLIWLGYELVRHATRGRVAWTWRRPKAEMQDIYNLLSDQLKRRNFNAARDTLERVCRQPGFNGVRAQSHSLCSFARQHGYQEELPFLFYVQKVNHGDRLMLD